MRASPGAEFRCLRLGKCESALSSRECNGLGISDQIMSILSVSEMKKQGVLATSLGVKTGRVGFLYFFFTFLLREYYTTIAFR